MKWVDLVTDNPMKWVDLVTDNPMKWVDLVTDNPNESTGCELVSVTDNPIRLVLAWSLITQVEC